MTKPNTARRRFLAALALFLAWVGALAAMAITSAERPSASPVPDASAGQEPAARPSTP